MAKCSQCGKDVSLFERDLITGACRQCQRIGARPASLGCGTLFLIALVVAVATKSGFDRVEHRVRELERSIDSLRTSIAQQSSEIRQLRDAIDASRKPGLARTR